MLIAPHAHYGLTTSMLMRKVNFSLVPVMLLSIFQFGLPTLYLFVSCVATALICEAFCLWLNRHALGKLSDGSALLTALILALSLPPHAPIWLGVLGSILAIIIGKQIYGGLGQNIFNPAMLARVVLLIAFPVQMTYWPLPSDFFHWQPYISADVASGATTLGSFKEGVVEHATYLLQLIGNHGGSAGETSSLLLLLTGSWLIYQRVFSPILPITVILGCMLPATLHWFIAPDTILSPLSQLMSGGLIFSAFYIFTDPVTGPSGNKGRIIYGLSGGLLIYIIRTYSNYPEGVAYAVLLVNALCPLIDKYTQPKIFGLQRSKE